MKDMLRNSSVDGLYTSK